jgi:hypothetical protein
MKDNQKLNEISGSVVQKFSKTALLLNNHSYVNIKNPRKASKRPRRVSSWICIACEGQLQKLSKKPTQHLANIGA